MQAGVALAGLTTRRMAPGRAGLIFGYGAIGESAIDDGVRRLAEVIADRGGARPTNRQATLAVYGTLRWAEVNAPYLDRATFLGTGAVLGALHVVPTSDQREYPYPALVADPTGRVVVEIYRLPDDEMLRRIDRLESFDPSDEHGSEYVRRRVAVLDGPVEDAWVYVFNGDLATLGEAVNGGDWTRRASPEPG